MVRMLKSEVILVTPSLRVPDPAFAEAVAHAADLNDVTAIWIRQPSWTTAQIIQFANELRVASSIPLWIGRDVDAAREVQAEAVILPSTAPRGARLGWPGLVGYSVHRTDEALDRCSDGADFVVFGPIRDTLKDGIVIRGVGMQSLQELCSSLAIPVIAIGGLCVHDLLQVQSAGAVGLAAIRSLWSSS